jgi:hypothetical protein
MTQKAGDAAGKTFDLPGLLYDLIQRAATRLKRRGCYKPDDCGPKLVNEYVVQRKLRKTGRCEINGGTISLNFPGARDPLLILYKLLSFEVMGFKRRCNDCNGVDQLTEQPGDNFTRVPPCLIDPATPETLLEATELFELIATAFPNETHRAAFNEVVIGERSYSEVAKELNVSVSALRQWICRDKKRIRKVLTTCWQ